MTTAGNKTTIHEQVHLPLSMVLEVVLQGIRIRLGRSLVTVLGVAMGIAFLMSMLTSQLIQQGVSQETRLRAETSRMFNFLTADCGPVRDATVGLLQAGPLSPGEIRLVQALRAAGATQINWTAPAAVATTPPASIAPFVTPVATQKVATDATAVIVLGDGPLPQLDLSALLTPARQKLLAFARPLADNVPALPGATLSILSRPPLQEELDAEKAAAKTAAFRSLWIIAISLLVTVIGITNSMLMSVTERFREIGTMKCLGALSSFIRRLFVVESALVGSLGATLGALFGAILPLLMFSPSFGLGLVLSSLNWGWLLLYGLISIAVGMFLSTVAAVYPARFASHMVPAAALRSNI